jgi:hypothetical protein
MAVHQFVGDEPKAPMPSAFVILTTVENFVFTAGEGLSGIMKLSRNSTRVVTFLPLDSVPVVLSGAAYKGIVSG